MPRLAARPRVARSVFTGCALVLALSLAACGSQLDPDDVVGANGGTGGAAQGGEVVPGTERTRAPRRATPPPAAPRPEAVRRPVGAPRPAAAPPRPAAVAAAAPETTAAKAAATTTRPTAAVAPPAATASRTAPASPTTRSRSATPPTSPARCPASSSPSRTRSRPTSPTSTPPATSAAASSKLVTYDSRTDAGADQQAYAKGCDEVFATVGSMSAFDSGGAGTAQSCGLPDIRSAAVTQGPQRLLDLLRRPVGQHRASGRTRRASSS